MTEGTVKPTSEKVFYHTQYDEMVVMVESPVVDFYYYHKEDVFGVYGRVPHYLLTTPNSINLDYFKSFLIYLGDL